MRWTAILWNLSGLDADSHLVTCTPAYRDRDQHFAGIVQIPVQTQHDLRNVRQFRERADKLDTQWITKLRRIFCLGSYSFGTFAGKQSEIGSEHDDARAVAPVG